MNQIKRYKEFLEFLSKENKPVTYKVIMDKLSMNEEQFTSFCKHMYKYYDKHDQEKGKESRWDFHRIEINHDGVEYLRSLEIQELAKNQTKFNRVIALAGCIIAFATLINLIESYTKTYAGTSLFSFRFISYIVGLIIIFLLTVTLGVEILGLYSKK